MDKTAYVHICYARLDTDVFQKLPEVCRLLPSASSAITPANSATFVSLLSNPLRKREGNIQVATVMVSRLEIHLNISGGAIAVFCSTRDCENCDGIIRNGHLRCAREDSSLSRTFQGGKSKRRNVNRVDDSVGDTWPGN